MPAVWADALYVSVDAFGSVGAADCVMPRVKVAVGGEVLFCIGSQHALIDHRVGRLLAQILSHPAKTIDLYNVVSDAVVGDGRAVDVGTFAPDFVTPI